MSAIITRIDCTMEPRLRLGRPLIPAGHEPGTARSEDQRLTYWAPSSLLRYAGKGTCVSSCIFKHVNIRPSTTWLVLLSEGKIASVCVCVCVCVCV